MYDAGSDDQDSWNEGSVVMPPLVTPRLTARRRRLPRPSTRLVVGAIAAAAMVIGAGVGFVWLRSDDAPVQGSSPVSSTTVDAAAAAELARVLPRGYSAQNCHPAAGPAGAAAAVACDRVDDVTAVFALIPDPGALGSAIGAIGAGGGVQLCPGRIQSPGPWRRGGGAAPVRGTLLCATPAGGPLLAWTDTDKHVLATAHGSSPEQLYKWWVAHA